eukprot:scaffold23_cov268-Pinguiococcus_pyrenoidosus.AAC.12
MGDSTQSHRENQDVKLPVSQRSTLATGRSIDVPLEASTARESILDAGEEKAPASTGRSAQQEGSVSARTYRSDDMSIERVCSELEKVRAERKLVLKR